MSANLLEQLEPNLLWRRFFELKQIPRPSKRESAAIDYVEQWAATQGFTSHRDAAGNLAVHVPAAKGRENDAPLMVQNHVDIVASNGPARDDADAAQGRIPVVRGDFAAEDEFVEAVDGDWIYAPHTTMGADNGIGCAMAMAVAEDPAVTHPPLELLFTVDEEEGMSGALNLDPQQLKLTGRSLINLDTEDDDELTIGSAGGCDIHLTWQAPRVAVPDHVGRRLALHNLRGGHSGIEINSGRANAIRCVAVALSTAVEAGIPVHVATVTGGDRRNAIPRFAEALVVIPSAQKGEFDAAISAAAKRMNEQFDGRDLPLRFELSDAQADSAFSDADSDRLINLLLAVPTGVYEVTAEMPELPETSNNLALVATEGEHVTIDCSARCTFAAGMQDILATVHAVGRLSGATVQEGNRYPGWKPKLQSPLLERCRQAYEHLFQSKPHVLAVHAGLECGVLASKLPELDCISFGPNIRGNHAPGERVQISSVNKSYQLFCRVLSVA